MIRKTGRGGGPSVPRAGLFRSVIGPFLTVLFAGGFGDHPRITEEDLKKSIARRLKADAEIDEFYASEVESTDRTLDEVEKAGRSYEGEDPIAADSGSGDSGGTP